MNHKPSMPDKCGSSAESLSCNLKELKHDVAQGEVPYESYLEASPDYFKGIGGAKVYHHTSSLAEVSEDGYYMVASLIKSASNSKSSGCRQPGPALKSVEGNHDDRIIHHLTRLEPLCRQCSDDAVSSDFRGRNELGISIITQPEDRDRDETWQAYHRDNSYQSDCNMQNPNLRKGKEHVSSVVEDSISISKEREDSHESVESSSSKRKISRCKRALSPDPKFSEPSNSKRQKNEKFCSGSSARQGSSFRNWISTITSGYMRSDQAAPLAFFTHTSPSTERHLSSLHKSSHEKNKDCVISRKPIGFRSIFQALCHPSLTSMSSSSRDLDIHREVEASKQHEIAREHHSLSPVCDKFEHNSCNVVSKTNVRISSGSKEHFSGESLPLVCDTNSGNLHNCISTSSEKLEHDTCHVKELLLTSINICSKNSSFHEKRKSNCGRDCHLNDMGPSRCYDNTVTVPPENKEDSIPVSVPNDSLMVANRRTGSLENLWIKRLFSEVSSSSANSAQCNQVMEAASKWVTNKCKMLDSNGVSSNREQSNPGYCNLLEGQAGPVGDEICDHSILPIDPYGSKGICDQKTRSNLNRIVPSQEFKKPKQTASVFAKRLDAFRHIRPSTDSDIATSSTITCFFCGKKGHSIRKCSQVDETELEDLLKNMNSFNGTVKPSCLCIRCFQLNHWAISCPRASSKREYITDNAFIVSYENCNRIKRKPGNRSLANYDTSLISLSGGKQTDERKNSRRGNMSVETELAEISDVTSSMAKVVAPELNNSTLNPVKKDIGESTLKVKLASSSSGENESNKNQSIPYCYIQAKVATDESLGIFETIRRLRLSRSDVIRWMKSQDSHFSLEGFFLRLRLGKREEGVSGTGYHVACINSINCENCLSVCIGGFTYLVDRCSISNHDFVEEELKAWWSAVLKGGGKPPAIEELNRKIQERAKFGF